MTLFRIKFAIYLLMASNPCWAELSEVCILSFEALQGTVRNTELDFIRSFVNLGGDGKLYYFTEDYVPFKRTRNDRTGIYILPTQFPDSQPDAGPIVFRNPQTVDLLRDLQSAEIPFLMSSLWRPGGSEAALYYRGPGEPPHPLAKKLGSDSHIEVSEVATPDLVKHEQTHWYDHLTLLQPGSWSFELQSLGFDSLRTLVFEQRAFKAQENQLGKLRDDGLWIFEPKYFGDTGYRLLTTSSAQVYQWRALVRSFQSMHYVTPALKEMQEARSDGRRGDVPKAMRLVRENEIEASAPLILPEKLRNPTSE